MSTFEQRIALIVDLIAQLRELNQLREQVRKRGTGREIAAG
jgi:hypothetical protein